MKLILIRHGDPNYKDNCLTPLGHAQAECLRREQHLVGEPVAGREDADGHLLAPQQLRRLEHRRRRVLGQHGDGHDAAGPALAC